ncbi:dehydratase (plasmid) [Halostagnicola larsenii XH-48]|uniref:Dehydratase n=1 Tax=Halostagnicola larsenii XH-48 TaxID=797299 RepID=W0JSG5_9EURY|nr:UxaA family hydrolase [Halostagnicola larsenii]AHG01626.1 dehydratase [Halostagnicola larsenii XH-48]
MKGETIDDRALVLDRDDTVATALADLEAASSLSYDGRTIELTENVPFGHKVAMEPIPAGDPVRKYGSVIATATEAIQPGDWVHTHNCESNRGRGDTTAEVSDR